MPREALRLLLLEFVTHERWVWDSRYFPFIQGAAEAAGVPSRWLCFGSRFRIEKTGPAEVRQYMHLEGEELAALAGHVRDLRPTHVVVSHPISSGVRDALSAAAGVEVLSLSDLPAGAGCARFADCGRTLFSSDVAERPSPGGPAFSPTDWVWQVGRTDWLRRWLGGDALGLPSARYLADAVTPSYRAVMANSAAREHRPHVIVMGGVSCDHFGPVAKNPHYDGVDLTGIVQDYGCAYCSWFRGPTSDLARNPVGRAEAQLRRIVETAGADGRFCGIVDLYDVRLFRAIDRFFEAVLRLSFPPTTFCFEPRLDRFVETIPKLERVLPRVAEAGHAVSLFRMGAESLLDEENAFYNKDVTLAQIDEAKAALERLAAAHPRAFAFDPTWGYITCSPWTTLEMLETGMRRATERGFEPLGVWLYTPLLLYRETPIARRAMRDGLVTERFEDLSLVYEATVNQVDLDGFLPWRFQDGRTASAFALVVRFCAAALRGKYPDTIFRDDPLYARLLAHEPELGGFLRPDLFAREAAAAVRDAPAAPRDALLDAALARYRLALPREPVRGPIEPRPAPPEDPDVRRLRAVAGEVCRRHARQLAGVSLVEAAIGSGGALRLRIEIDGAPYELHLRHAGADHLFRSEHFGVAYDRRTPLRAPAHVARARSLVTLLDRAMSASAPELLPAAPRT